MITVNDWANPLYKHSLCVLLCLLLSTMVSAKDGQLAPCKKIDDSNLRLKCYDLRHLQNHQQSSIDTRRTQETQSNSNRFSITPHKPNYILPLSHNSQADYRQYGPFNAAFNKTEVKFQISLKFNLATDLPWNSSLDAAYTQQSYWQLYAKEGASAPFRETNHEPEIIWSIPTDFTVFGLQAKQVSVALNHQSNGRAEPLSRSWNRLTNQFVFEQDRFVFSFEWWLRIKEHRDQDDNPDIETYMGRTILGLAYVGDTHSLALGIKNNASKHNKSGIQLDWTFPLNKKLRGYIQLYSGYGENLIDQKQHSKRISLGLALTDWL